MKAWKTVFGLVGWAGLALMLSASVASAQVNACNVPDQPSRVLQDQGRMGRAVHLQLGGKRDRFPSPPSTQQDVCAQADC